MKRSVVGMTLAAVVAIAAAVAVPLLSSGTAGEAVIAAPPGAPRVGDCVRFAAPTDPSAVVELVPDRIEACDGARFSEVMGVGTPPQECPLEVTRSLGLTDLGTLPGDPTGRWLPYEAPMPLVLLPNDRQQKAGQDWVACAAVDINGIGFAGPLADLYTDPLPLDIGTCTTTIQPWSGAGSCTEAHVAEWFAVTDDLSGVDDLKELTDGCAAVLRSQTLRPDLGEGDGLKMQLRPDNERFEASDPSTWAGVSLACGIAVNGTGTLADTLRGIGPDADLPLA